MPVFSYRATTIEGAIIEGVIEAADENSAIERLKNTGYIPLRIAAPRDDIRKRISLRSIGWSLKGYCWQLPSLLRMFSTPAERSPSAIPSSRSLQSKRPRH